MSHSTTTSHHIVPLRVYLMVAVALMIMTVVTVAVSYIDLGGLNIVIALAIAAVKATLVLLFFMHLKYDWKLNTVVFLVAIAFLAIFMTITMFDVAERGDTNPEMKTFIRENAVIYDDSGRPLKNDSTAQESEHETVPPQEDSGGN